jgi:hypothetical protein
MKESLRCKLGIHKMIIATDLEQDKVRMYINVTECHRCLKCGFVTFNTYSLPAIEIAKMSSKEYKKRFGLKEGRNK